MTEARKNAWKKLIRLLAQQIVDEIDKEGAQGELSDNGGQIANKTSNARSHLRSV